MKIFYTFIFLFLLVVNFPRRITGDFMTLVYYTVQAVLQKI